MKRNISIKLTCLLLVALAVGGCGAKKAVVAVDKVDSLPKTDVTTPVVAQNSVTNENVGGREKIDLIQSKNFAFSTLVIRSKAVLAIAGKSNDVTMNIRIRSNEAIWVSVTALAGLEVARAMITPDSVRVINRLENEYIAKPFSYIHEFTNNKINFATLQAILVGNMITDFVNESAQASIQSGQTQVQVNLESMLYRLLANEQGKVLQNNLSDDIAAQKLEVVYGDFQAQGAQLLPNSIVMKSEAKSKSISLDLKFSKIDVNVPAEMPFRVPDRYVIKN